MTISNCEILIFYKPLLIYIFVTSRPLIPEDVGSGSYASMHWGFRPTCRWCNLLPYIGHNFCQSSVFISHITFEKTEKSGFETTTSRFRSDAPNLLTTELSIDIIVILLIIDTQLTKTFFYLFLDYPWFWW